ncbi:DUF4352 domain-containing protein [Glaciimonas immobilis]|uniref:DUF4352 domain-containing protein n=1 Tax=Glaciimonas immobilis TaxID=728004 RepID=A0A840RQH4_9BURK|nr:DUF4352 domain-containing protein [Glaciimonas immobilis]KAF3999460.1 DUF4352 domain-containing protein [Glaciimonas immobilis]MBB5198974.1 hypothetical protein [Glaciimonas immobilis]
MKSRFLYAALICLFFSTAHAENNTVITESQRAEMEMTAKNHRIDSAHGQYTYLVIIYNKSEKAKNLSGRDFVAIDGKGARYSAGLIDRGLINKRMTGHETRSGVVGFEIPVDRKIVKLLLE